MSDQIEFSSFYNLLNSIKEGKSEEISLLDEKINEFENGNQSKSFLDELGSLYLSIGIKELYNFTNTNLTAFDKPSSRVNLSLDQSHEHPNLFN